METPKTAEAARPAPGLISILQFGASYRWVLAAGLAAFTGLGLLAALALPPVYRATVALVPVENSAVSGLGLANLLGNDASGAMSLFGLGGGGANAESVEFLSSQALAREFISRNNRLDAIAGRGAKGDTGALASLRSTKPPTIGKVVSRFRARILSIDVDELSEVIRVHMSWGDRELVADWANAYVLLANTMLRDKQLTLSRLTIQQIQRELETASTVEGRLALSKMLEGEIRMLLAAKTREEFAFRIVDPAVVPDIDDFVSPKRLLILLLMPIVGLLFAIAFCLVHAHVWVPLLMARAYLSKPT